MQLDVGFDCRAASSTAGKLCIPSLLISQVVEEAHLGIINCNPLQDGFAHEKVTLLVMTKTESST